MGGRGSGRGSHLGSKRTVDSSSAIDIRYLKKQGLLLNGNAGTLSWSRNGRPTANIGFSVTNNEMILNYTSDGQNFRYPVAIVYSACNYGGQRPWLQCPKCHRRVGKLMLNGKTFICRHCGDLAYQSQRENDADRFLDKAQELRQRLGGSANIFESMPWKPKGMHWKTYYRLRNNIEQYQSRSWGSLSRSLNLH